MDTSGYYIDLHDFRLAKLKGIILNIRLLPSQQILRENIEERFACLKSNGIKNLQQLQEALKKKSDVESFAQKTGLPVNYLTILRREVNSYKPKPINLKDFPGVNPEVIHKLDQIGIKNTKQLFLHVLTPKSRSVFAEQNHIRGEDVLELTKLTDMARLKWVGPKFARLMIETEYDTVEKIARADGEVLYRSMKRTNEEKNIYKGNLGQEDINSWIEIVVREVPQVIVY